MKALCLNILDGFRMMAFQDRRPAGWCVRRPWKAIIRIWQVTFHLPLGLCKQGLDGFAVIGNWNRS